MDTERARRGDSRREAVARRPTDAEREREFLYNRFVKPAVVHAVSVITRSPWVRFHMSLILLVVFLAGIGTSFALLRVGVRSMPIRYVTAVLVGYLLFLLGVRLWLWFVRKSLPLLERELVEVDQGTRPTSAPGGWGRTDVSSVSDLATAADIVGFAGDGCLVGLVVSVVLMAIGGMVAYVLVVTPELLGEAVVQLALAAALRRKGKVFRDGHWTGSVVRMTWGVAFVAIFGAAILGLLVQSSCPTAVTIFDAISSCK